MEQIESRELLRDELVPIYKVGSDKEFLYHESLQHIYVINIHDKLTRIGTSHADVYFESIEDAEDMNGLNQYSELARKHHNDLMNMSAKVKPYKKKG